ncbi:hypothetical protein V7S43_009823 [Phytophthora oleae]|uniref:WRKY19-like zinc finger domain-containing protein n=1 Tax=Phytophthora oleae TaxID=2107226 RepID=A0ABD3FJP2_9STRA
MEAEPKDLDGLGTGNGQPPDAPDGRKLGLPFILNVPIRPSAPTETRPLNEKTEADKDAKEEKKRRRTCRHEGCHNYIVHKGLCCRHGVGPFLRDLFIFWILRPSVMDAQSSSVVVNVKVQLTWPSGLLFTFVIAQGGKKCSQEGCNTSAKHRGLCWKHGGSVVCKENGCDKKAKARGLCWAHGGGTKCRNAQCIKVAVSNGFCWAHGGGKRCAVGGCIKPAYGRTHNLCQKHFVQVRRTNYCVV